MKLFNKSNPLKKLSDIFGPYIRGDAPDPATSPQGIVPKEFTQPDDPLKTAKKDFFRAVRLEDMPVLRDIIASLPEAVTWLEPDVASPQTGLLIAAKHNCPKATDLLCEHGADVKALDSTGCPALTIAAEMHYAAVVKVLLAYGSPPDIENNHGESALSASINHLIRLQTLAEKTPDIVPEVNYDTIRILIEAGADPLRKNKHGDNAYTLAETLHDKEAFLSILGAHQTRMDNAEIQAGKKPVIRVMKPLRLKN